MRKSVLERLSGRDRQGAYIKFVKLFAGLPCDQIWRNGSVAGGLKTIGIVLKCFVLGEKSVKGCPAYPKYPGGL